MTETFIKIGESYINTRDIKKINKNKNRYDTICYTVTLRDTQIFNVPNSDVNAFARWLGSCSYK